MSNSTVEPKQIELWFSSMDVEITTDALDFTTSELNATDVKLTDLSKYFSIVCLLVLHPILSLFALCANILNTIVFRKMDLTEGVSLSLFILSLADGFQAGVNLAISSCVFLIWFGYQSDLICLEAVTAVLVLSTHISRNMGTLITTVIAIVRCCCVTMPFTVQEILTARRQLVIILVICSVSFTVLVSSSSRMTIACEDDSRFTIYNIFSPFDQNIRDDGLITFDLFRSIAFSVCFLVVCISMVVLILGLKKSAMLRTSNDGDRKNQQIVKSIILVLAIFLLCNLLQVITLQTRTFTEQFTPFGTLHEEHTVLRLSSFIITKFDISSNIFVYYYFNRQFRVVIKKIFSRISFSIIRP
ncbi:chemosensory receptor a [Plakobranchus ocellatus]|uniref:Chemosensory receptor a n=1 Tax=Plakobranchus ocellatus TaxID=259542 RepID=A0AAV4CH31_9GAST|nr:chemosensory receptor a [Plakobranchus ocellatus]